MRPRTPSLLASGLVLLGLFVACRAVSDPDRTSLAPARAVAHAPREPDYDVEHYALDLELEPALRRFSGRCDVRLASLREGLDVVALDLAGLDVHRVDGLRGGVRRALDHAHERGVLRVHLTEPLARGEELELSIEYGGAPRKGLWFSGDRGGVPTQVFTQSECEDARWWYPCWDAPADFATSELEVTMPESWTSVAAGELVSSTVEDGRKTERWVMETPHATYLTTLVAGEFVVREERWDEVPLLYLARPELADWMEDSFAETPAILAFLEDLAGVPYPYPKYSQACVDGFPVGGMENASATTLTEWTLSDDRGQHDATSHSLVAHEAAHQWFGDLLTCRDWSHIWLNEGFATYLALLWVEESLGREEFLVQLRDAQEVYLAADTGGGRRPIVHDVYREPIDLFFGGHTYQGGATRLHLLRLELGDEDFFAGVHRYVRENAGCPVVTADLRRAMEAASGRDLSPFFDQWLYRSGFPELRVGWSWREGDREVRLTVEQLQDAGGGTPAVFRMPVDVEVRTPGGARIHRIRLERRRQEFRLPADERPDWVKFDDNGWIPKRLFVTRPVSTWIAMASEDDDPNGRRDAVRVLADAALGENATADVRRELEAAVAARLVGDSCAAVRRTAAVALARFPTTTARKALVAAAGADADARVRVAALEGLRLRGAHPALAELARTEFDRRYSWLTMGACAGLLCAAAPDEAFDWIHERLELDSPHGVLRGRLLTWLGELDDDRVLALLLAEARDETLPDLARIAAVEALGRRPEQPAAVREALVGLLHSRDYQLRRAVLDALRQLDDPRAAGALRAYRKSTVHPLERNVIDDLLRRWSGV